LFIVGGSTAIIYKYKNQIDFHLLNIFNNGIYYTFGNLAAFVFVKNNARPGNQVWRALAAPPLESGLSGAHPISRRPEKRT